MTTPHADPQRRLDEAHEALLEACQAAIAANETIDALQATQRRTEAALASVQQRVASLEAELDATHRAYKQSLSWRVTRPLRWAGAQRLAIATRVHRALANVPLVHAFVRAVARTLRLVPRHDRVPAPAPTAAPELPSAPPEPMTQSAQRLHEMIASAPRKD